MQIIDKQPDEQIEQYLRNEMSEAEKIDFQFQLLQNESLRKELAAMRVIQKNSIALPLKTVKSQLSWWWLPLLLSGVLGLLYFAFFSFDKEPPLLDAFPVVVPEKQQDETVIPRPDIDSLEKDKPSLKKATPATEIPTEQRLSPPPSSIKKTPPPIAANFEANPVLEKFMGSSVRGDSFDFSVLIPSANAVFKTNTGSFEFQLQGQVRTEEALEDYTFRWLLFSNQEADYKTFRFLESQALEFTPQNEGFAFKVQTTLDLPNGLYYYIIEDEDSGEMAFVEKFEIR